MPNLYKIFEEISQFTWKNLFDSYELEMFWGEETITDLNLLSIKRARNSNIHIIKTSKYQEKLKGIDWEWWIGSGRLGWARYAVQAKKIDLPTTKYRHINHKVQGRLQIDILEEYALETRSIPLYCFYNYTSIPSKAIDSYWQCGFSLEREQFGCTFTPLEVVKELKNKDHCFEKIHSNKFSKPLRCLVKCPALIGQIYKSDDERIVSLNIDNYFGFSPIELFPELPEPLRRLVSNDNNHDNMLGIEDMQTLYPRQEFLVTINKQKVAVQALVVPKQILVVELDDNLDSEQELR